MYPPFTGTWNTYLSISLRRYVSLNHDPSKSSNKTLLCPSYPSNHLSPGCTQSSSTSANSQTLRVFPVPVFPQSTQISGGCGRSVRMNERSRWIPLPYRRTACGWSSAISRIRAPLRIFAATSTRSVLAPRPLGSCPNSWKSLSFLQYFEAWSGDPFAASRCALSEIRALTVPSAFFFEKLMYPWICGVFCSPVSFPKMM